MGIRFVTVVMAGIAALLAAVATRGQIMAIAAVVVALGLCVLAVLGRERTAILAFGLAFATAPMYRGLLGEDLPVSPTDLLLLVGVVLLAPELFTRQARIPAAFLISVGLLVALGLRGAAVNEGPVFSLLVLVQWLVVLAVLPIVIALWQPSTRVVEFLLWSYVAGHMVSCLVALAEGPLVNNRYDGLTHHSNAFGTSGAVAIAIVLYLWPKYRDQRVRAVLVAVTLVSGASVIMSGSRAATIVVVALVLLVPAVERSAMLVVALAAAAGIAVSFFPHVVEASGEGSSISRLVGDSTAKFSDNVRDEAIDKGWERFRDSPLLGSGMDVGIAEIHNLYLEVAIAVGLFGLLAYLLLLYVLARPLIGHHPERRLAYFAWVFIIIGPAVPGLTDRSMLLPMALAILPAIGAATRAQPADGRTAVAPAGAGT